MRTLNPSPGKFEGSYSQATARAVYDRVCNGFEDESAGSIPEFGWIASLVKGKRFVFILVEDSQGFVTVTYFRESDPEWRETWDVYVSDAETLEQEEN